ncbi:MAG: maleylpyruvate isomerase N-terminal domain-containing protein [Chloroflexota bacterium]
MTDRAFEAGNAEATAALADLVSTLGDADLAADLGEGWTVAMALAHLAYWDSFHLARWVHAAAGGLVCPPPAANEVTSRSNEALEATWRALPVAATVALFLDAAAAIDTYVAALADEQVDGARAADGANWVDRAPHRRDHTTQIALALGRA